MLMTTYDRQTPTAKHCSVLLLHQESPFPRPWRKKYGKDDDDGNGDDNVNDDH